MERALRVLEFTKIRERLAGYAITDLGAEKCRALTPSSDFSEVSRALDETEEAVVLISYVGGQPLSSFQDVREQIALAEKGAALSPRALLDVAGCLRAARSARAALVKDDREDTPILTGLASRLTTLTSVEQEISDAILSEDEIADRASAELYQIRRQIRTANERMREKLNQMIRSSSFAKNLQDNIITMRGDRYCIPVKAECRGNVPGLVHDQSATGATLFIEPMALVELGNDLKQYQAKEQQEITRILQALSARVAPNAEQILTNIDLLTHLDFAFAKGLLAREMHAVLPKLNQRGYLKIVRGRHPLIDPEKVVPSNLWLGDEFTTLIITGPNTGGKTVTLKTVGLFTLMAQAGLQVPADLGTELSVFRRVYADIGDEQSIEQSLSTFSGHMKNIVEIMGGVQPGDLALFDELGAGTDPTEGAALAQSILSSLLARRVRTMATTHYSELKAFALSTPGVENASVEFDVSTLRPTYRLSIGIPGKSNAFEI
ncbi:MAG: endonuclease MutS2, partial [Eubacteriales bacterium]|nr:endonuclease MutS2 [Eubacteriales bacterium]